MFLQQRIAVKREVGIAKLQIRGADGFAGRSRRLGGKLCHETKERLLGSARTRRKFLVHDASDLALALQRFLVRRLKAQRFALRLEAAELDEQEIILA